MELWRKVWRLGIAPQLSVPALMALAEGLRRDDPRLLQGATTTPPPLQCVQDWPVEGACVIGYGVWQGELNAAASVVEIEEAFAKACFEADVILKEPAACRWFINWADDTPRPEMIRELLKEVELAIWERALDVRTA